MVAFIWLYGAVDLVRFDIVFTQLTDEMFINYAYFHVFLALGLALFTFYLVIDLVKLIIYRRVVEYRALPPPD